jgi:exonuclease VII large subunit
MEFKLERSVFELTDRSDRVRKWWIETKEKNVSSLNATLENISGSVCEFLRLMREKNTVLNNRITISFPIESINSNILRINHILHVSMLALISQHSRLDRALHGRIRTLRGLGPMGIMKRGYAFCTSEDGNRVIAGINDISQGDAMIVNFHDGGAKCRVEEERKGFEWQQDRSSKTR